MIMTLPYRTISYHSQTEPISKHQTVKYDYDLTLFLTLHIVTFPTVRHQTVKYDYDLALTHRTIAQRTLPQHKYDYDLTLF